MKKIFVLIAMVFTFSACDDGDITLESFNFTNQQIQKCSDINKTFLFKINDNELLLLDITATPYTYDSAFTTFPYTKNYSIDLSTTKVLYRLYNESASNSTICSTIAPASPAVVNEWNATGGTLEVTTTQRFDTDGTTLLGYTHSMRLVNINFANSTNSFSFQEYFFGNYQTSI